MTVSIDFAKNDMALISSYAKTAGIDVKELIKTSVLTYIKQEQMDIPNAATIAAIEEGEKIAHDLSVKGYSSMSDLIEALEA